MKQKTFLIRAFILLILFILPCNAFASEKPEIFVQIGHVGDSHSVAFSPDGKYCKGRYGVDFVEKINKLRRNLCLA